MAIHELTDRDMASLRLAKTRTLESLARDNAELRARVHDLENQLAEARAERR